MRNMSKLAIAACLLVLPCTGTATGTTLPVVMTAAISTVIGSRGRPRFLSRIEANRGRGPGRLHTYCPVV